MFDYGIEAINFLIQVDSGCNCDLETKAGYTPLHVAAHFGQVNAGLPGLYVYALGRFGRFSAIFIVQNPKNF